MDNPFFAISLQLAKLQESVDCLLASKSENITVYESPSEGITFDRKELAQYLRCSLSTVDRYKRDNVTPFIQAGRTVLFKKSEVDAAMSSLPKKKGAKPHG